MSDGQYKSRAVRAFSRHIKAYSIGGLFTPLTLKCVKDSFSRNLFVIFALLGISAHSQSVLFADDCVLCITGLFCMKI